ncbi:MAG TPA: hypothetical protein VG755_01595 [Nannocystaceae bacterium]|nr:hypothetical protein [Nannocystaceae bacterium]
MLRALAAATTITIATSTAHAAPARGYEGVSGSEWQGETAEPEVNAPAPSKRITPRDSDVPPPRVVNGGKATRIAVAVGLSPEAPGSKDELALLERLERNTSTSTAPPTTVRRLRAGGGDARSICRDRRDDLVVFIGYVPKRPEAVVLAHDCRLDVPLGIRATAAVDEPGLVGALWDEHEELVRQGMQERRRLGKLSAKARAGIAASVAIIVIGTAIGLLVANALRDEKVVLKVAP